MDEAWDAVLERNLSLAEKLARRAIDGSEMNPRLWFDLGRILRLCGRDDDAEEALRRAIAIAPTHAEAFAELAALQAAAGKWVQAERLQRRAVELRPDEAGRTQLAAYAARLPASPQDEDLVQPAPEPDGRALRFDWERIAAALRDDGLCPLPGLLDAAECAELRAMWDQPRFEHAVVHDDDEGGRFEQRYLQRPLPPLVEDLRRTVYRRLAPLADDWMQTLHRRTRFPRTLTGFLQRCADRAQHRSAPNLVRHPAGGWQAPRRDVPGPVVFPFALTVDLGPDADTPRGGAQQLVDLRPGRRPHRRRLDTEPGDGALFCTEERMVRIGGALAAQPVQYGVEPCTVERFALVVPFHDHG